VSVRRAPGGDALRMLSENDIKEELSYAYVHTIATRHGA
jgi:hypothetical protein